MLNGDTWPDDVAMALAACYRLARERARAVREHQAQQTETSPGEVMSQAEDVQAQQSGHENVGEVCIC